jgi:Tol biopolymer transport system component
MRLSIAGALRALPEGGRLGRRRVPWRHAARRPTFAASMAAALVASLGLLASSLPAASRAPQALPAAAPGGVAIPPRLAFDATANDFDAELHAIHLDGSASRPPVPSVFTATSRARRDLTPSWSPDGRQLAYAEDDGVSDGSSFSSIDIVNANDTGEHPLLPEPPSGRSHRQPAWSPGGRYIAFADTSTSGEFGEIVIQDLVTGSRTVVPACAPPAGSFCGDQSPAWDRAGILPGDDGKPAAAGGKQLRLAFARTPDAFVSRRQIMTVTIDPPTSPNGPPVIGTPAPLTSEPPLRIEDNPSFSPDGRFLAFDAFGRVGGGEFPPTAYRLVTFEFATGRFTDVLSQTSSAFIPQPFTDPTWTPDGTRIVFSSFGNPNPPSPSPTPSGTPPPPPPRRELWSVLPNGTGFRRIAAEANRDLSAPDFQPAVDLSGRWNVDSTRVNAGTNFQLTLTIRNVSDFAAPNATAQLAVAATSNPGVVIRGVQPAGTCVLATLRCSFGTLAPGATVTVTLDVGAATGGTHRIQATLDSGRFEMDAADNVASTAVVVDTPDIAVTVSAAPAETLVGFEPIVVTYTIRNLGTGNSGPVFFRATLPAVLPIISVRVSDNSPDPDTPTTCPAPTTGCNLGVFHNERVVGIEITLSPDAAVISTAEGTVDAKDVGGNPANDHASTPIAVHSADIAVTVEANPAQTLVGRTPIVVKYTVRDNGTGSTGPVQFKATLPAALPIIGNPVVTTTGGPPATCANPVAGCDLGAFSPTRVVTIQVTLRPAVLFIGDVSGDVTAPRSTGSKDDNHAQTGIRVDTADLLVTVAAVPPRTLVGHQPIVVTYTIRNAGTGTTGPVRFTATLPTNTLPIRGPVVVTSSTNPGTPPPCPDPVAGCELGFFVSGRVVTITVTLSPDAPFDGEVVGEVTADESEGEGGGEAANNVARTRIRVDTADISVAVVAIPPKTFVGGDPILVRYAVTNAGTGSSGPVQFTATLPTNVLPIRPPVVVSTTGGGPITCPNPTQGCNLGPIAPGQVITIEVTLSPDAEFGGDVVGTVVAPESTGSEADNTSRTRIDVVSADIAVAVTAAPNPSFVGGDAIVVRYTVTNPGGGTTAPVRFTAALPEPLLPPLAVAVTDNSGQAPPACANPTSGCDLGPFPVEREVVIQVTLKAAATASGEAVGTVEMSFESPGKGANNIARAPVVVLAPTIVVTPDAGKPGYVPTIVGRNFPPGAKVHLRWDRGVTAWPDPVTVGADGTFRAPMIILHKDVRGMRNMVATHAADLPDPGPKFGPTVAPCLVVSGSDQPDDWYYRR